MNEKKTLQSTLDDWTYTCGYEPTRSPTRYCGNAVIQCHEPVGKLYYTVGSYENICIIILLLQQEFVSKEAAQCSECTEKDPIKKRC